MTELHPYGELLDYAEALKINNLYFSEKEAWLVSGKCSADNKWLIFISVVRCQLPELLDTILPILVELRVPFILIKNRLLHQYINIGRYGNDKLGKVITLFPVSERQATKLVAVLQPLVKKFTGPKVLNTIRVGQVLYACFSEVKKDINGKKIKRLFVPKKTAIPFKYIEENVQPGNKIILGKRYVVIKKLRASCKGDIYKALYFKGVLVKKCIIKQGIMNMVDDLHGRTIRDRLLWQKKVLTDLNHINEVPKVIYFFEDNGDSYLVMEYKKGHTLVSKIQSIYKQNTWKTIPFSTKATVLEYFLKCLQILNTIHEFGFVHRDIKAENFMIAQNGSLILLDFEVAYSIKEDLPKPVFRITSPGYQAPVQPGNLSPNFKEDIYSLGTLFTFLVTNIHPAEFVEKEPNKTMEKLYNLGITESVIQIIIKCLAHNPFDRPEIRDISTAISDYVEQLKVIDEKAKTLNKGSILCLPSQK